MCIKCVYKLREATEREGLARLNDKTLSKEILSAARLNLDINLLFLDFAIENYPLHKHFNAEEVLNIWAAATAGGLANMLRTINVDREPKETLAFVFNNALVAMDDVFASVQSTISAHRAITKLKANIAKDLS